MKRENRSGAAVLSRRLSVLRASVILSAAAVAWASRTSMAASLNWDPSLTATAAGGGSGTWDLSTSSNWFNGTADVQWTDGDTAAGGVDTASFGGTPGTVSVGAGLGAAELIFTSSGYTLSGANVLSLGATTVGGVNLGIDASTLTSGTTTIGAPINLVSAALQTWNVGGGSTLVAGGGVSGTLGLNKAGNGILTLSGDDSSLAGGVHLSGGQLNINNANALGTGTFSISTSFIDNTSGGAITDNVSAISLNGTLTFIGTNNLSLGSAAVTIATSRVITTKAGNLEFDGPIGETGTGGYSFTKQGAGTLTLLSNANAWTGVPGTATVPKVGTVILGGTLDLGATGQLPNIPLVLGGGGLNITNTGLGARSQSIGASGLAGVGALALTTGQNAINLTNTGTGSITLTAAAVSRTLLGSSGGAQGTTEIFRGNNLGVNSPGSASSTNIVFSTAPAVTAGSTNTDLFSAVGSGTLGTTQAAVLRGALVDNGNSVGFATYDPTNGVRLLNNSSEQVAVTTPAGYTATAVGDNVYVHNTSVTLVAANPGKQSNTLQIDNTSGSAITFTNSGTALDPRNGLLFSGTSPITLTGGSVAGSGADIFLLSTDTAPVTLGANIADGGSVNAKNVVFGGSPTSGGFVLNSTISASSSGGFFINGVTVNASVPSSPSSNGFVVDGGGKLILSGTFSMASARPFLISSGSTVDMNGISVSNVDYLGDFTFNAGGTITNSNATASTLTMTQGSSVGNARTYTGIISGNINLVRAATSTVTQPQTLSGASNYTGTTLISSGTLRNGISNALPVTTPLTINGGGTPAATFDLDGFNQTVGSLASSTTTTGGIIANNTASTASIFTVNGSAITTFGGTIVDNTATGGTVGLGIQGTGILSLTGNNTYSGGTSINGGMLKANNATSSTGSGFVRVNSGGSLGGTGTVNGSVTVNAGGHLSPGDGGVGTLTLGPSAALTLSGKSILDYDFSLGGNDLTNVQLSSGLTLNGVTGTSTNNTNGVGINVFASGTNTQYTTPGTYNLFQFSGSILGTGIGALSVLNPAATDSYLFGTSGNFVTLTITSIVPSSTWNVNADGNWGDSTKWNPAVVPNGQGSSATFGSAILQPHTVTLNGTETVGSITFNNANRYTIAPGSGTLFLDNGTANASVTDLLGSHTISAPMSLSSSTSVAVANSGDVLSLSGPITGNSGLAISGSGTVALTGANTYLGNTSITGGIVQINSASSLGSSAATTTLTAATLEATTSGIVETRSFRLGSPTSTIQIDGSSGTYEIDGNISDVSISQPGTLNLTTNGSSPTLILAGINTYTGGTNIPAGAVLQLGNTAGTAGATLNSSGTLTNNGTINVGASLGSPLASTTAVSIANNISGSGPLNQFGGKLALSGSNANFSGAVTINNGILSLGSTSTTGTGVGNLALTNSTITETPSGTIGNNATTSTAAAAITTLTVNGALNIDTGGASNMTLAAQIIGASGTTITRSAGTGTLSIGVPGNTNFGITAPFANTFSGTFTNNIGAVTLSSRGVGSTTGQYNFNAGPTYPLTIAGIGGTENFGSLSGNQPIANSNNTSATRLSIGSISTVNTTYSGVIGSANGAGTGGIGVQKVGTGTLTLSGQNLYAGQALTAITGAPTIVQNGTLIAASNAAPDGTYGPFGPTTPLAAGIYANYVLIGANGTLNNTNLQSAGVTVANPIVASGGGNAVTTTAYTLSLGGINTTGAAAFTGGVTLENNLTVTQTAGGTLNLTGGITGTDAFTGPDNINGPIDHGEDGSANTVGTGVGNPSGTAVANTGYQTLTFAGPGNIVVSASANAANSFGIYDSNDPNNQNNDQSGHYLIRNGFISVAVTGGTTTLAANDQYSGSTAISGGKLVLGNLANGATPTSRTLSSLNVTGGSLQIAQAGASGGSANGGRNVLVLTGVPTPGSGSLSIPPTPAASLTISGTGNVDVTNNDLIVQNATPGGVSTVGSVPQLLKAGFNAGAGYWNGAAGIVSSSAAGDTRLLTTLGYAAGGSTFDGVTTTSADVVVKYTYYGDANLDGVVNGADYQQIDLGFGSGGTDWSHGDFNYDGVVNGSDFALIDNIFNQLTATGASSLAIIANPTANAASLSTTPAFTSAVPEPTMIGLLSISAIASLARRRRRPM